MLFYYFYIFGLLENPAHLDITNPYKENCTECNGRMGFFIFVGFLAGMGEHLFMFGV